MCSSMIEKDVSSVMFWKLIESLNLWCLSAGSSTMLQLHIGSICLHISWCDSLAQQVILNRLLISGVYEACTPAVDLWCILEPHCVGLCMPVSEFWTLSGSELEANEALSGLVLCGCVLASWLWYALLCVEHVGAFAVCFLEHHEAVSCKSLTLMLRVSWSGFLLHPVWCTT